MRLKYTPKEGFAGPPFPWPARDHTERSRAVARRKIESGFYRQDRRRAKSDARPPAEAPAGGEEK